MSIKKQHHDKKLCIKPRSCDGASNSTNRPMTLCDSSLLHLLLMPFSLSLSHFLCMLLLWAAFLQLLLDPFVLSNFSPHPQGKDVRNTDMDVAFIWVMIMAVPPFDPLTSLFTSTEKNQMPTLICMEPISFPPVTRRRGERLWITVFHTN